MMGRWMTLTRYTTSAKMSGSARNRAVDLLVVVRSFLREAIAAMMNGVEQMRMGSGSREMEGSEYSVGLLGSRRIRRTKVFFVGRCQLYAIISLLLFSLILGTKTRRSINWLDGQIKASLLMVS